MNHFFEQHRQALRHALATIGRVAGQRGPAIFSKGLVGFPEALRRGHHAIIPLATFFIAGTVQRQQQSFNHLAGFFQNGVGEIAGDFRRCRHRRPQLLGFENIIQNKTHIVERCFIGRHAVLLYR